MGLFDQVKGGLNRAAAEAEKQANIAKLNLDKNGVKGEIGKKLSALGEVTLKLAREGVITHESISPVVAEIAQLEAKIAELDEKIARASAAPAEASKP